jgi:four helix bundle protein
MQDFKKLIAWQKSHEQYLDVYKVTETFPRDEAYRLTDQLRKAVDSVKANVAEGAGKPSDREFRKYVSDSIGSQFEVENHLISARDLKYLSLNDFERLDSRGHKIRRMLISLHRRLSVPRKPFVPPKLDRN